MLTFTVVVTICYFVFKKFSWIRCRW